MVSSNDKLCWTMKLVCNTSALMVFSSMLEVEEAAKERSDLDDFMTFSIFLCVAVPQCCFTSALPI